MPEVWEIVVLALMFIVASILLLGFGSLEKERAEEHRKKMDARRASREMWLAEIDARKGELLIKEVDEYNGVFHTKGDAPLLKGHSDTRKR